MSKKLCFIDDDRNELERFKQAIASDELIVGTGTMGGEALNDIAAQGKRRFLGLLPPSRHVDLYVLDMYYPTGGSSSDAQLSKLGKAWDEFRAAEAVFKRLLAELGKTLPEDALSQSRSAPSVPSWRRHSCSSRERAIV